MTPEDAVVKSHETLVRIENLLKRGASAAGGGPTSTELRNQKVQVVGLTKQLNLASKAVGIFKNEVYGATKSLNAFRKSLGISGQAADKSAVQAERIQRRLSRQQQKLADKSGAAATGVSSLGEGSKTTAGTVAVAGTRLAALGVAFKGLFDLISGPGLRILTDYMYLTERGVGSSLGTLYKDAIMAGMSLQEYTQMLEENRAAAARAGSFDEFNKRIETTSKQLENLGVFGADARRLAGSLQNSATALGIPQQHLAASTTAQVKVFEDLRKSTMMTSEGFKQLVETFAANQNVQEALLGLAPEQREARRNELLQIYSMGQQMGLTEDAARRLGDAMMEQRRATAKERFEAAGRARQLGAVIGMSAAETEEFARLSGQKNLTAEEATRYRELAADAEARMQALQNSGNMALQFAMDQFKDSLTPAQRVIMEASGAAQLQADAGEANNKDFGKAAGTFAKAVGNFAEVVTGLTKSPFYEAVKGMSSFASSMIGVLAGGMVLSKILGKSKPGSEAPELMGPPKPGRGFFGNLKAISNSILSFGTSTAKASAELGKSSSTFKSVLKGMLNVGVKGGILGFIFSAIEEAFTGEMAASLGFGESIAGRIMGVLIGAFNGIFTGFTRIIDGSVNFLMKGLGIEFKSNLTHWVDHATLWVTDLFKVFGLKLIQSIKWVFEKLGLTGGSWYKSLQESEKSINDSLAESQKTREKMQKDENATLRSIGEQAIKDRENQEKKKQKQKQKINLTGSVAYGIDDLVAKAARDTKAIVAALQPEAEKVQATPVVQSQQKVTAPEVNKEPRTIEVIEAKKEASTETANALKPSEGDMVALLKQQLDELIQIREVLITQNGISEEMASKLTKAARNPREINHLLSAVYAV